MSKDITTFFTKSSWKKKPVFAAALRSYTTFQCAGVARVVIKVCCLEELQKVLYFCNEQKAPFLILGKGSNSIFSSEGFDGVLLLLDGDFKKIHLLDKHQVLVGAGVSTTGLASWLKKNLLGGGEFLLGIPASVGGVVFMNAGAGGIEIKKIIKQVTSFSLSGLKRRLSNEIVFDYRYSSFMESQEIITSAVLQFFLQESKIIQQKQQEVLEKRKNTQPIYAATWGSVFQNSQNYYAADLIEKCGFKGKFFGKVQVSSKHSNFFENKGNASYEDIKMAIIAIQRAVFQKYKIFLRPEVRIFDVQGQLIKKFYQTF